MSSALEPVRLQLKWSHQFQFAGYYAAIAKGYYAEAGFDVTLLEAERDRTAREVVMAGDAEYGVGGSELVLRYLEGEPVVVLAAIFQHSPLALMVLESSGIDDLGKLAGRKVMLREGAASAEIYAMLATAGIRHEDFQHVPHTLGKQELLDGSVDAVTVYTTELPFFPEMAGAATTLFRPAAFGADFYGDCLFASRDLLIRKRSRVEAFREASLKGWRYAMENPGEIIAWIEQNYPGRRTAEQLRSEAAAMQALILPELIPVGQLNSDRWARIARVYRDLEMSTGTRSLDEFLYREPPHIDRALVGRLLWLLGPFAAIVASWIAFLVYFNRRLKTAVRERTATLEAVNRELRDESLRRGEVEAAFRSGEERYRTIVETTREWIWEINLDGRHTYCNPAIEAILGYSVDAFLAMDSFGLIHPEDRALVDVTLPAFKARGIGWEAWVLRWRHRDGTYRYLESNAAPVRDSAGVLCGYRGVDRDITDRIEAERLLTASMQELARHQEQLEALVKERTDALERAQADLIRKERLATLGQIIGTVSHEIRNPLGTIRSSVFSIRQMLKRQEHDRIDPVLDRAERNVVRCDRIIEELLDFTRPRSLEQQPTHLDAWLKDVVEEMPIDGDVCVSWQLESDAMARIDREQFRRAIVNVVSNAMQSMHARRGGTLRVTTARVDGDVEIVIADEGEGIAPENLNKVYEPLFSTKGFGVGLGVPIIKDIVDAHGGRLHYESTVGLGTSVHIWLPVG